MVKYTKAHGKRWKWKWLRGKGIINSTDVVSEQETAPKSGSTLIWSFINRQKAKETGKK